MRNKLIMLLVMGAAITVGGCDESAASRDEASPMVILAGQIAEGSVFTGDGGGVPAPAVEEIVKPQRVAGTGAGFRGETPW